MPVLFAQNLVEHGSLDSVASNIQRSSDSISGWLATVSPTTWMILAAVVVVGFFVWSRR
jgi:hypothetical protein